MRRRGDAETRRRGDGETRRCGEFKSHAKFIHPNTSLNLGSKGKLIVNLPSVFQDLLLSSFSA
ncbi:MAG: hypothetical protein F6K58_13505 [Symploca sp. SIO2E9]|nr:hypothetical protein [Symploca sp. SIO2E9]